MNTAAIQSKNHWRGIFVRLFCFMVAPFAVYYCVLDLQYNYYIDDYKAAQILNPTYFSFKAPLSYVEYLASHQSSFLIMGSTVFMGALMFLFVCILMRKEAKIELSNHSSHLKTDCNLQRQMLDRFKEHGGIISTVMNRLGQSYKDAPLSTDQKSILIKNTAGIAQNLSIGVCSSDQRDFVLIESILEEIKAYFASKLHTPEIKLNILCPKGLTFIGDPLFAKVIFFSVIGYPLFTMKRGEVSVVISEENEGIHLEVWAHQPAPLLSTKEVVELPAFFVENDTLRQLCIINNVKYESSKTPEGKLYTKVSFPMDPDQDHGENVVPLFK